MKILITGNCGFIGQNFVRLYKDEHEFIGIDMLGYASDLNATKLCPTWPLDLSKDDLNPIFKYSKFDAIVHFAACSHVDNSIKSPEPFIYSNYIGTFKLLEMAKLYGIKRFLITSTDEVLGDLQFNEPPFSNPHLLKPSSPYSASKAAADLLVLSYHRTYGMDVVITRSVNNYGPFQYKEKLIPVIISNALNNKSVPIYGTGNNIRSWVYVEDNCKGIMAALQLGKSGSIYNLDSGIEKNNIDLTKQILNLMNKPLSLIKMVEDRKGHDLRYAMDWSLSKKELNWESTTHLDNGLKKTIEWYTGNQNYWKDDCENKNIILNGSLSQNSHQALSVLPIGMWATRNQEK